MTVALYNTGHRRSGSGRLEDHDSVLHACGGNQKVAKEVLKLLDESLESGVLNIPRSRCLDWLVPLEEAEGDREGKDRGSHRMLKVITVMLRLKGFNSRDCMMPVKELDLTGHPLLSFSMPSRAPGAGAQKVEPVIRSLESAVHLARASSSVMVIKLGDCQIGPEGGDKCLSEIVRLVRRMGIGLQSRFLEEVDLHGNLLDAESVRKIVEAAVKERCERTREAPSVPLWLDLSGNRVRNAATLFQNLQAWAGWAHDCEGALCLADADGCSRKACVHRCMLHMPKFTEQSRPEASKAPDAGEAVSSSATPAALVTESTALVALPAASATSHRMSPVRRRPGPRPTLQPLRTSPWKNKSRRRPVRSPPRLELKPGPGAWRSRSRSKRSRRRRASRPRGHRRRAYDSRSCSRRRSRLNYRSSFRGRRASSSSENGRRIREASASSGPGSSNAASRFASLASNGTQSEQRGPEHSAAEYSDDGAESELDESPCVESDAGSDQESCRGSSGEAERIAPSSQHTAASGAEDSVSDSGSAGGSQTSSPASEPRTSSAVPPAHDLGQRLDRLLESLKSTARAGTVKDSRGHKSGRGS